MSVTKPKLIENPNTENLKKACEEYLEFLDSEEYSDDTSDDYKQYIFEQALECFYGMCVWDFVNEER